MAKFDKLNHFATNIVKMDMRRSKFNLSHIHFNYISSKMV